MEVVVTKTPDGWVARHGELAVGRARTLLRPDDRCFVAFGACRAEAYRPLVQAIAQHLGRDLYTEVDEADADRHERLVGLGFEVNRRSTPTPSPPTRPSPA